ncbi:MAG: tetratricopeptide repeat protein, partial [Anaerolineales bacterium]|nr:tetratricopeptide repeat protein [Anaerolineales bacterium]
EAIKLYRRSITLLPNEREKAITWNRLGILYRQVKDYGSALEAYQQADLLDPQQENDGFSETVRESKMPLTVSKPSIDIESLISDDHESHESDDSENRDFLEINAELEITEEESNISWSSSEFLPADPDDHILVKAVRESIAGIHSKWKPATKDETAFVEIPDLVNKEKELETVALEDLPLIIPIDLEDIPQDELDDRNMDSKIPTEESGRRPMRFEMIEKNEPAQSGTQNGHDSMIESIGASISSETESESTIGSQVANPSMELSETEMDALELDIVMHQQAAKNNPRNYAVWEMLGDAYKSAGQYKEALLAYQKAISVNSNKPSCFYRLGLIYAIERNDAEAVTAFQKVLELVPDHAQAHASLASQYLRMGMESLAQAHIEKALNTNMEDENDYNRACLEAICGNNERALELLEIALQTKQTYVNWV